MLRNKTFWLGKAIYRQTSNWMEILGKLNIYIHDIIGNNSFTKKGTQVIAKSNTKSATRGIGASYPSGTHSIPNFVLSS